MVETDWFAQVFRFFLFALPSEAVIVCLAGLHGESCEELLCSAPAVCWCSLPFTLQGSALDCNCFTVSKRGAVEKCWTGEITRDGFHGPAAQLLPACPADQHQHRLQTAAAKGQQLIVRARSTWKTSDTVGRGTGLTEQGRWAADGYVLVIKMVVVLFCQEV